MAPGDGGPRGPEDRNRPLITPIPLDALLEANAAWHEVDEGLTKRRGALDEGITELREGLRAEGLAPDETPGEAASDARAARKALNQAQRALTEAAAERDAAEMAVIQAKTSADMAVARGADVKVARRAIAVVVIILASMIGDAVLSGH